MGKLDRTDIIGGKFGMLTVKEYVKDVNYKPKYLCICDCGNEKIVDRYSLLNGEIKTCGCLYNKLKNPDDIVGNTFGRLHVVKYLGQISVEDSGSVRSAYECKCDCGKVISVWRNDLISGRRTSCTDCTSIVPESDYFRYYDEKGDSFIFDASDYAFVSSYRWSVNPYGYPVTTDRKTHKKRYLARMLLGVDDAVIVDHINGDSRDERRMNLRIATRSENQFNMGMTSRNKTGFKGVCYVAEKRKYKAQIRKEHRNMHIGYFHDPIEAARAYDEAARLFHGEFACLNFPREGEQCCRRNQEAIA